MRFGLLLVFVVRLVFFACFGIPDYGGISGEINLRGFVVVKAEYLLPPDGFIFFLFARTVQVDRFNRAVQYAIVAYDAATKRKVATLPLNKRDGNLVLYRDPSGSGLVALDTRGKAFPVPGGKGVRLFEPTQN